MSGWWSTLHTLNVQGSSARDTVNDESSESAPVTLASAPTSGVHVGRERERDDVTMCMYYWPVDGGVTFCRHLPWRVNNEWVSIEVGVNEKKKKKKKKVLTEAHSRIYRVRESMTIHLSSGIVALLLAANIYLNGTLEILSTVTLNILLLPVVHWLAYSNSPNKSYSQLIIVTLFD